MIAAFKGSKLFSQYGIIVCLFISIIAYAEDNNHPISENRLKQPDNLDLETLSLEAPKTIEESIKRVDQFNPHPPIDVDLKNELKAFDHPENNELNVSANQLNGKQMHLADVRALALKNNLSIQVATFNPQIASETLREESAKFDRVFFASARYGKQNKPDTSGDNVRFSTDNPTLNKQNVKLTTLEQEKRALSFEAGIKIPLRSGGSVAISSPFNRVESKGFVDSDEYRSALRFSISQPLLRNAGRSVNEASIQIANVDYSLNKLKARLQSIRVIAMVDKAYWDLYEKWAVLDVQRHQHAYADQNLQMVKRRVKEGLTARVEINRAEIGVAERLDNLVVADTDVKLAQRQLQFYLNAIDDQAIEENRIIPITQPELVKYTFDRNKMFESALASRIDLLEQELKLSADLIKIDYLENQTLPLFTIDYQYGALSDTESRFSRSYSSVFNGDYRDWSVGLKFEMPITNEARKAKLDRAIKQRMQRLTTKQLQTLTVKREIHDSLDKVEQNWKRILLARQQVLIAGMNYEAELKQFNEGLRTMTEVLETLSKLGIAQTKEIKAIVYYQVSLVDAAYATGTLLGYGKLAFR